MKSMRAEAFSPRNENDSRAFPSPLSRRTFLLVGLGLVFPAIARPAGAAERKTADAVLAEVNAFRASQGKPRLLPDGRLSRVALMHSQDMMARNQMTHTGRDGSDPGQRMLRAGYAWRAYRENVAAGQADARQVVMSWVNSHGHRANMLADDVTQVGVGHVAGPGMMAGNVPRHFWTLVLAAPR